ncbi:MAG: hypothetical protein JWO78_1045 [Micavibrio sp.]|nr:hypothetical protein [Micavibrio sp.]
MTASIENRSREQIAAFLPDAITTAMTSYQKQMEAEENDDLSFKEKHASCKTALAHIELLLKLARWADLPDAAMPRNDQVILAAVLAEAERELAGYGE